MKYLVIKRRALKEDGWTYGDWRQYVAFLDDKSAVCCRISTLPATLAVFGFIMLSLVAMAMLMATSLPVNWGRVAGMSFVGFASLGPWLVTWFTQWRLVVAVGPKQYPKEDGSYYRVFDHEVE